jgi:hypothetical protein
MAQISISDLERQGTVSLLKNNLVSTAVDQAANISLTSGGSGTVSLTPTRAKPPHYDPPYYELGYSDVKIT